MESVLGAMSLMMKSSTTIISLSAHTHTRLYTKHHNQPSKTHTQTHILRPLQHSATYIWCWRVQGLRLVQASQPLADSGKCSYSVWSVLMAKYSCSAPVLPFPWNKCPKLHKVHRVLYTIATLSQQNTHAEKQTLMKHLDLKRDSNNECSRSNLMASFPRLSRLHAL